MTERIGGALMILAIGVMASVLLLWGSWDSDAYDQWPLAIQVAFQFGRGLIVIAVGFVWVGMTARWWRNGHRITRRMVLLALLPLVAGALAGIVIGLASR